ncbi:YceI family protein [Corynebacterium sp. SCR221107]|uniref:YceI family protein n=1 Tax=Corynebacterium sp. SCR221107 TaxID=3017361 RepID=UPI0022EC4A12|nr:YceI family protein [Corynebacterium sp. SCR221107]WBT09775.1 YceI family protein [Corynebacterium sp. SCR221107]
MSNFNGTFTLDPVHSTISFITRHAMVTKVRGKFDEFEASFTFNEEDQAASTATATIQSASINTGNDDRDAHVKGDDFFSVEQFPTLTFNATKFDIKGDEGTVTGDLTIKGVTKEVTLDVEIDGIAEDPFGVTRLGFEAKTKINRKDFGVDFNAPMKTGGVLLSEEIKIEIVGSATKQA